MSTFDILCLRTPLRDQRNRTGNPAAAGARPHTGTRPLEPRLQRELRSTQPRRRTKRHVLTAAVERDRCRRRRRPAAAGADEASRQGDPQQQQGSRSPSPNKTSRGRSTGWCRHRNPFLPQCRRDSSVTPPSRTSAQTSTSRRSCPDEPFGTGTEDRKMPSDSETEPSA